MAEDFVADFGVAVNSLQVQMRQSLCQPAGPLPACGHGGLLAFFVGMFVLGCCVFWCCCQPIIVYCRRRSSPRQPSMM